MSKQPLFANKRILLAKRASFLGLFLFFLPVFCFSQQVLFQNPLIFNSDDGLPSNRITKIVHDIQGFTWIGTTNGLARFDGITVETYSHSDEDSTSIVHNTIYDILPDLNNGKVWVTTPRGVSVLDIHKNVFKTYKSDPHNPYSIPDHQSSHIIKDKDGQIWIGFRVYGIVRYRPETDDFQPFLCTPEHKEPCDYWVFDIQEDLANDSILWLGGNIGISRFNKITGAHELYSLELDDPVANQYANSIRTLMVHPNGKIYYGTWYEGVIVFDTQSRTLSRLNPCYENGTRSFGRDVINGFYPKSEHEIWINSALGLQLYNTRTGCITFSLTNENKDWFSVEYIDKDGRIWSASHTDGLRIFNPLTQQFKTFQYESPDTRFPNLTRKILEDTIHHKLIVGAQSSEGMYVLDQISGKWQHIRPPIGFDIQANGGFNVWDMAFLDKEEVLVVEDRNLYLYKPGHDRLQLYPLQPLRTNRRLRNVLKDHEGDYWISSYNAGILRLDVRKQELYSFDEDLKEIWHERLGGDHMAEDTAGNIWIREHNGLLIYERAKGKFIYHPYDPTDIKSYRGMGVMEADEKGRVWIASQREFLGYGHADSLDRGVIQFFGKKDGLLADNVYRLKIFKDKVMVFTDHNLQVFNPERKRFERHFDLDYGLIDYTSNAIQLSTGEWAVGKSKAIALFIPDSLKINREAPHAYISAFRVFDQPWNLNNIISHPDSIYLSYAQNFFSFEFSAIGYNMPGKNLFRYKLEGFDKDWQEGTKRKFAAYTNVPGGNYTFKVEAMNNEGIVYSEPSVTYLFISTIWYKTLWFWGLVVLSLVGLVYLYSRWRISQVRKEERLKSEYERKLADVELSALRAQMNPHFIFNSLNSIEYYIINNESEKASDYLNRFSRLIRLILQNSKSTRVPLRDEIEALKLYIEMESLRFDNHFNYEVRMENSIDPDQTSVPPLLIQPYVENAIWHGLLQKKNSEKGKLDLTLRRDNGHLICLIEDNGIGREAAQQLKSKSATRRKSYGMKITSDRMHMLNKLAGENASVQVFDLQHPDGSAAGTRVELVIPL